MVVDSKNPTHPPEHPLATMPTTRRAVLTALKRHGAMPAQELASELGITVPAVRQQLTRLASDGLVTHRSERDRRGRPSCLYELAPAAETMFPKRYGDLTTELLGHLGGPDSSQVTQLFE
jgi:DeoR family transcriptional regulator, suf operon transcriptional repressor